MARASSVLFRYKLRRLALALCLALILGGEAFAALPPEVAREFAKAHIPAGAVGVYVQEGGAAKPIF